MNGDRSSGDRPRTHGGLPERLRTLFRRDRVTGQFAVGLVGVLGVVAVMYGVGTAGARYELVDVGAWLSATSKGMVVHANGPAGKVDGKITLPRGMRGHRIKIVQDGGTVLLIDEVTGVTSRIDPSQLKIERSVRLGGVGIQIVVGSRAAYAVDPAKGTVQRIDAVTLAAYGGPASLTPPLGQAGMDSSGTLWVPAPQSGQIIPFKGGTKGAPVTVGKPNDRLALTIAAGVPVAINTSAATASVIRNSAVQQVVLPPTVTQAVRGGGLKVPVVADGPTVAMLGTGGAMYLLNTQVGQVSTVALRLMAHRFEAPYVLGSRVYLPDVTLGRLLVFNILTGAWERPMQVSRPGAPMEVFVRDGFLWANDPTGGSAIAVERGGALKRIQKYDDRVPDGQRVPIPDTDPNGGRGPDGSDGPDGVPGAPARPPADDTPSEPQNVRVDPSNGQIRVTFRPSAGGRPTGYVLKGDAAGLQVRPERVPTTGPYQFVVAEAECAESYGFSVVVQYRDSNGRQAEKVSLPSAPVRPCTPPTTPTGFNATPRNHGATLTWNASGADVKYLLSVNGGSPTVVNSPHTVTGLANAQIHEFRLTARNPAGSSIGQAATQVNLAYPTRSIQNQNNGQTNTIIRPGPSTAGTRTGTIPRGQIITMIVVCQTRGAAYTDPESGTSSNIWNRVQTQYGTGYLNDTLVAINKGAYPSEGLYECQM